MLKLGPHFMTGGTGLSAWLRLGCTLVKYCRDFPQGEPLGGALLIGRADHMADGWVGQGDPVQAARAFYATALEPAMIANPHIPAWESPNEPVVDAEGESLDTSRPRMRWYAAYLPELARLVREDGRRMPVLGAWPVGNPTRLELWAEYGPVLQAIRHYGGLHSRHSYGVLDEAYALRHRRDQAEFDKLGYPGTPTALTEVGLDHVGGLKPWRLQYGGSLERYFNEWLAPMERELRRDPYVIGATVFTLGTGGDARWNDFDLAGGDVLDLITRLASLAAEPWPSSPPAPPSGPVALVGRRIRITASPYLRLRRGPGGAHDILTGLLPGTELLVLEQRGVWARVTTSGWISTAPGLVAVL
jgi:hypothetical protein